MSPDIARPVSPQPPAGMPPREAGSDSGSMFSALLAQASPRPAEPPPARQVSEADDQRPHARPAPGSPGDRSPAAEAARARLAARRAGQVPGQPAPRTDATAGARPPEPQQATKESVGPADPTESARKPSAAEADPPTRTAAELPTPVAAHPPGDTSLLAGVMRPVTAGDTDAGSADAPALTDDRAARMPTPTVGDEKSARPGPESAGPAAAIGELAHGDLGARAVGTLSAQPPGPGPDAATDSGDLATAGSAAVATAPATDAAPNGRPATPATAAQGRGDAAPAVPPSALTATAASAAAVAANTVHPATTRDGASATAAKSALAGIATAGAGMRGATATAASDPRAGRSPGQRTSPTAAAHEARVGAEPPSVDAPSRQTPGSAAAAANRTAAERATGGRGADASDSPKSDLPAAESPYRTLTQAILEATGARSAGPADGAVQALARPADPLPSAFGAAPADAAAGPPDAAPDLPTGTYPITVPFADERFPDAIAERVTWLVREGLQGAELTLNPQELGPIRIELSMDGSAASIGFSATHAETRNAIEQALPRLREMLAGQGLHLGGAQVDSGGQRRGGDSQGPRAGRGDPSALLAAELSAGPDTTAARAARTAGRVDLFA